MDPIVQRALNVQKRKQQKAAQLQQQLLSSSTGTGTLDPVAQALKVGLKVQSLVTYLTKTGYYVGAVRFLKKSNLCPSTKRLLRNSNTLDLDQTITELESVLVELKALQEKVSDE